MSSRLRDLLLDFTLWREDHPRALPLVAIVLVLALLGGGAWYYFMGGNGAESTAPEPEVVSPSTGPSEGCQEALAALRSGSSALELTEAVLAGGQECYTPALAKEYSFELRRLHIRGEDTPECIALDDQAFGLALAPGQALPLARALDEAQSCQMERTREKLAADFQSGEAFAASQP